MADKLTSRLDIRSLRVSEVMRIKFEILMDLEDRKAPQQLRAAIGLLVDQGFDRWGKVAMERLCQRMSATTDEVSPAPPMSAKVRVCRTASEKSEVA